MPPESAQCRWEGDLTSGRVTDVDRHIALFLKSRGPYLIPVAYLKRPDFRRVGNAYYSQRYGRLVMAKAIEPATNGRPENIRDAILRHYLSVGCESAAPLPADYRSTTQAMKDVISGPPARAIRGRCIGYLKSIGELRALRRDGTYKVMMSVMGQPGHGSSVRRYAEAHQLPNERARVVHTRSTLSGATLHSAPEYSEVRKTTPQFIRRATSEDAVADYCAMCEVLFTDRARASTAPLRGAYFRGYAQ